MTDWPFSPPSSMVDPESSRWIVDLVGYLVCGVPVLVFFALTVLYVARVRTATRTDGANLQRRRLVVLQGHVESVEGSAPVRVEIEQELRAGAWIERGRSVRARPFELVLHDGRRVRVDPRGKFFLRDELDQTLPGSSASRRVRAASLNTGEEVFVAGVVHPAADAPRAEAGVYRAASGELPTLRPPRIGKMIISTTPCASEITARRNLFRGYALAFGVAFAVTNLAVLPEYNLLRGFGTVVWAAPTHTRHWRERVSGKRGDRWEDHYEVRAEHREPGGATVTIEGELGFEAWSAVQNGQRDRVPFVVVRRWPAVAQVGTGAMITSGGRATFLFAAPIVFAICLAILSSENVGLIRKRAKPWYERRRVDG